MASRRSLIFHVDIDAFFASVEQVLDPRLKAKPVIVGNGCIASCSYEARLFGLTAGMSLREAVKLCPDVIILDGSEKVYRCYSRTVFDLCLQIAPSIETFLDEAYLDLSGTEGLYGSPFGPAAWLKEEVLKQTGLTVTIGIGRNRMIAKIATKNAKPDAIGWIRPDQEEEVFPALPIARLPGVGPKIGQRLGHLNVKTIKDMQKVDEESLVRMFGKTGSMLYRRCRGEDTRVVHEREIPRTISRETTFHKETRDRDEIEGMLHYLGERAMRSMRSLGLETRTVEVSVRYEDFQSSSAQRSLPRFTRLDRDDSQKEHSTTVVLAFASSIHPSGSGDLRGRPRAAPSHRHPPRQPASSGDDPIGVLDPPFVPADPVRSDRRDPAREPLGDHRRGETQVRPSVARHREEPRPDGQAGGGKLWIRAAHPQPHEVSASSTRRRLLLNPRARGRGESSAPRERRLPCGSRFPLHDGGCR